MWLDEFQTQDLNKFGMLAPDFAAGILEVEKVAAVAALPREDLS